MSSSPRPFSFSDVLVKKYLRGIEKNVLKNLDQVFTAQSIAAIKIEKNSNPESQNVPGYYDASSGTFYFSIPKEGGELGDLDWLFLHEALPGHHMQMTLDKGSVASKLFSRDIVYMGFY